MKNEDKRKNKRKLKYIGVVVVIALLAGIGLASADVLITDELISIEQNDPNSNALYVNDTFVNDDAAVVVNFTNPTHLSNAYGINVTGAHKTNKGRNIGIRGWTSLNYSYYNQEGSAAGFLAQSEGYTAGANFYGVYGRSTPNSLNNFQDIHISRGLGGRFCAGPDDDHILTLDTTGTYWVGGVYGEVEGEINGAPDRGAVAGVIGVDNTIGNAQSYAGYFDGRVGIMGNVGIGTTDPQRALHINGTTYFGDVAYIGTGQRIQAEDDGGARILGEQGDTAARPAIGFFSTNGVDDGSGGNGIFRPLANTMAFATGSQERMRINPGGDIGIGTTNPARKLHVNDVMRLEPRSSAPSNPSEGDIYMNGVSHKLMVYDGTTWQACW